MKIRVTPAPGLKVHHADGKTLLDPAGETLDDSPHWRRRETEGDVTIEELPAEPAPAPAPAQPARSSSRRQERE